MSRKIILTLAATTAIAAALVTSSAYARGFGGMHFSGARFSGAHMSGARFSGAHRFGSHYRVGLRFREPGHRWPGHHRFVWWHHHEHGHWVLRGGRWIVGGDDEPVGGDTPVAAVSPGPCTCLTKTYTKDGLVVFADICTKEAASAPIDGGDAASGEAPTTGQAPNATQTPGSSSQAPTSTNYAGLTYKQFLAMQQK